MQPDTRRSFHHQLDEVRFGVVRLAAHVTESLPRATDALLGADAGVCDELIRADDVLDALATSIEDHCFHLLALQQPMARDMRTIVTAIRLASEIERSGDLVVNVAKAAGRIRAFPIDHGTRGLLARMSEEALALFRFAVDAYVDNDEVGAAALDRADDVLDAVHRDFIGQVLRSCRSGVLEVQAAVQLALVGRYYERIGDHAVNMGERVCYMVSGRRPGAGVARPGINGPVVTSVGAPVDASVDTSVDTSVDGPNGAPSDAPMPDGTHHR